ncbi:MAG: glycosyl transferase [Planctomycetaceae bacterium]|nr:glycosyl transferase [Planctomycetaceae bacterium]
MPVLHLVIPFLDEEATLEEVVSRVGRVEWPEGWHARMILVDDGSAATARDVATSLEQRHVGVERLSHASNRGKGAAVRTGFKHILDTAGDDDLVGIQDADLEYDPADLVRFVQTFDRTPDTDAVVGNRWLEVQPNVVRRAHRFANGLLTLASNLLTGLRIHDMECCYKVIRVPMLHRILPDLDEDHFGVEPQLAAALARYDARVAEVGVSYDPRSFADGKKIGLRDGVEALAAMFREWRRSRRGSKADPR